jgi:hypothetical protein
MTRLCLLCGRAFAPRYPEAWAQRHWTDVLCDEHARCATEGAATHGDRRLTEEAAAVRAADAIIRRARQWP